MYYTRQEEWLKNQWSKPLLQETKTCTVNLTKERRKVKVIKIKNVRTH